MKNARGVLPCLLSTALSPHSIAKTTPATRRQREATKNYQQRRGCKNYEKEEFQALFLLHFGASSLSLSRSNLIKIFLLAFRDEKRINTARERRKQKRVKKLFLKFFFFLLPRRGVRCFWEENNKAKGGEK
jgi:hypothetical protein